MSLLSLSIKGIKWTSVSFVSITILQFAQLSILSHLLTPQDFGLMAMLTVIYGFVNRFADMGISNAIIHRQDIENHHMDSLFWINIFFGLIIFTVVCLWAPFLSKLFNEPRLDNLIYWVSIPFVITPMGQLFQVIFQKKLCFKTLGVIDAISIFLGVCASILLAFNNHGVMSMIMGMLVSSISKTVMLIVMGWSMWRPGFHFSIKDIKPYLSFGLFQMGEKGINYISANIDYIIIGRYLGPEVLGVYRLAYELVIMPMQKLNPVLTNVAFPIFAIKQNDSAILRKGYLAMIKVISYISSPLIIGLAVISPAFVPIVFGPGWEQAIPLIRILALLGILKALFNPCGTIFLAKGRADIGFYLNIIILTLNTVVFFFAVKIGVTAVAWCFLLLNFAYSIFILKILNQLIFLKPIDMIKEISPPILISVLMGFITYCFFMAISACFSSAVLLLTTITVGMLSFFIMCFIFQKDYFFQMIQLIKNRQ